jgi:hypothetical protein
MVLLATSPTLEDAVRMANKYYYTDTIFLTEDGKEWEVWNSKGKLSTRVRLKRNRYQFFAPEGK